MTEPTHHLRPDVEVQIDKLIARVMLQMGLDEIDMARDNVREVLSSAWHSGWMAGFDDSNEQRRPTAENPYHWTAA